jgi:TetR/AcrR family transcriptional regulator, regulator of cefoperazone and chloramphenicol sensitivity
MSNASGMDLKIIEAAIACVERYGVKETTVRKIAQEAGVNVAAINYYFRSKEQLMERVQEITLSNAFDWSHFSWSDDYPPKPRLIAILDHMVMGAQAYPEITRSHFITPLVNKDSGIAAFAALNQFMEKIYCDMVARGAESGDDLRVALLQAVTASILGIGLHMGLFGDFCPADLSDPAIRKRYIERLVDRLL